MAEINVDQREPETVLCPRCGKKTRTRKFLDVPIGSLVKCPRCGDSSAIEKWERERNGVGRKQVVGAAAYATGSTLTGIFYLCGSLIAVVLGAITVISGLMAIVMILIGFSESEHLAAIRYQVNGAFALAICAGFFSLTKSALNSFRESRTAVESTDA